MRHPQIPVNVKSGQGTSSVHHQQLFGFLTSRIVADDILNVVQPFLRESGFTRKPLGEHRRGDTQLLCQPLLFPASLREVCLYLALDRYR